MRGFAGYIFRMTMDQPGSDRDDRIEREIHAHRKFSFEGALAQKGGGLMSGGTPVSLFDQTRNAIRELFNGAITDPVLETALEGWLELEKSRIEANIGRPIDAVLAVLDHILNEESVLVEFVRQVDFQAGRLLGEKPHFQRPGEKPHPEDQYTHKSVRVLLQELRDTWEGLK